MKIQAQIAGEWLLARIDRAPAAYSAVVAETMMNVSQYLYDRVYENLGGQRLQTRSGRLRDALEHDMFQEGDRYIARVLVSGVPYAGIQERGGVTRPHEIVAKNANVLRFEISTGVIFAMRVRHPGSRIPESMYMRSVLINERSKITSMIRDATREAKV